MKLILIVVANAEAPHLSLRWKKTSKLVAKAAVLSNSVHWTELIITFWLKRHPCQFPGLTFAIPPPLYTHPQLCRSCNKSSFISPGTSDCLIRNLSQFSLVASKRGKIQFCLERMPTLLKWKHITDTEIDSGHILIAIHRANTELPIYVNHYFCNNLFQIGICHFISLPWLICTPYLLPAVLFFTNSYKESKKIGGETCLHYLLLQPVHSTFLFYFS